MSDYKCPICEYRSSEKQSMDDHVSSVHEIAFKLQCSQCAYNTPHAGHLKKHMKGRLDERDSEQDFLGFVILGVRLCNLGFNIVP